MGKSSVITRIRSLQFRRGAMVATGASLLVSTVVYPSEASSETFTTSTGTGLPNIVDVTATNFAPALGLTSQTDSENLPPGMTTFTESAFLQNAIDYFGSRYAGAWIDRSNPIPELIVAAINSTDADRSEISSLAGPDSAFARLQPAQYTLEQLKNYQKSIDAALSSRFNTHFWTNINVQANRINVITDLASGAATSASSITTEAASEPTSFSGFVVASAAAAPTGAFEIDSGVHESFQPNGTIPTSSTRTTYPPYKGGETIASTDTCTTGLTMENGQAGGVLSGSSAAHCFRGSSSATMAGLSTPPYGDVIPNYDAEQVRIASGSGTATVLISNGQYKNVDSVQPTVSMIPGQSTCYSGITSGESCGTITLPYQTFPYNLICGTNLSFPGDSGAPEFTSGLTGTGVAAQGIVSGDVFIEMSGESQQFGCFTDINLYAALTFSSVDTINGLEQ